MTTEIRTTDGCTAIINLQAQIEAYEQYVARRRESVPERIRLIDLIALRGNILGRIVDYEYADGMSLQLAREFPEEAVVLFMRARTRAVFHRFKDALVDLDQAERLGMSRNEVDGERAAVLQAIGRYDEALGICTEMVRCRANFESLGALAVLYAETGDVTNAERTFQQSRDLYRGVSPFALAMLDFQRGHMWMTHGDLRTARVWFEYACRRLPAYARAQGHLAEVEAELDKVDKAISRLRPVVASSDDPDYAVKLAFMLKDIGRIEESRTICGVVGLRYDELVSRHPEAFADHAAEFWLKAGFPDKALRLAQRNLEARETPRAHKLLLETFVASMVK